MVFSYNFLQSFFSKKLPKPENLAELLILHSFEVEEVKRVGDDFVLDIDVLPNRAADCFSHMGIAKECSVLTGLDFQFPKTLFKEDKGLKVGSFVSVEVKDKTACPRYFARAVSGVKIGPSPKWLKDRLKSCGLRPINNIVDIANYVMLETGQPLHAFDGDKIEGKKIIVRFAKAKEKIVTLDEQKFDLDSDVLVIADEGKPVAIAGIKGGKLPGIDTKTKNLIIESANFNPSVIRKASRKLGLKTDASLRFEHGFDPNMAPFAADRAAFLIQKLAGGKVAKGSVDVYPNKVLPKTLKVDLNYVNSMLGKDISAGIVKAILQKLGFQILKEEKKLKFLLVKVPTIRQDVTIQEDVIEEIGRISGYDKIEPVFPFSSSVPPKKNLNIFWQELTKDIFKEAGFCEVYNYSFFGQEEAELLKSQKGQLIEVKNPLSSEQKYLRISLLPNLLKNVERNINYTKDIRIFELGKIFKRPKEEKLMLAGLMVAESFYHVKGAVDHLFEGLGAAGVWYDEYKPTPEDSGASMWHPKKCAEIKIGDQEIGFLGEISPKVIGTLGFKESIVSFDIDFEKLSRFVSEEKEYRPISRFPSTIRDIAVLVPRTVKVDEVLNKINGVKEELVVDVDLFDAYEGEELPKDKKNLAFHIIYQAKNRTLKSEEVDKTQDKIIKALEENPGWQVRK